MSKVMEYIFGVSGDADDGRTAVKRARGGGGSRAYASTLSCRR